MSQIQSSFEQAETVQRQVAATPEKYLIAFVIQGDDVFKITADNIIHTIGTASGPAFDAIAKLKAAAALLELTNRHKERPDELRQMARELASEGMKLMATASSDIRSAPAASLRESVQAAMETVPAVESEAVTEHLSELANDAEAQEFFAGRALPAEAATQSVGSRVLDSSARVSPNSVSSRTLPQNFGAQNPAARMQPRVVEIGLAAVPKSELPSEESAALPGDSPSNAKISLISV